MLLIDVICILSVKNGAAFFIIAIIIILLVVALLKTCGSFEVFNQLGSAHNLTILLFIACILRLWGTAIGVSIWHSYETVLQHVWVHWRVHLRCCLFVFVNGAWAATTPKNVVEKVLDVIGKWGHLLGVSLGCTLSNWPDRLAAERRGLYHCTYVGFASVMTASWFGCKILRLTQFCTKIPVLIHVLRGEFAWIGKIHAALSVSDLWLESHRAACALNIWPAERSRKLLLLLLIDSCRIWIIIDSNSWKSTFSEAIAITAHAMVECRWCKVFHWGPSIQ